MENKTSNLEQNEAMPYDALLCTGLTNASQQVHKEAKLKGFWDSEREVGTLLMLCVSELAEALEADRKNKYAIPIVFKQAVKGVEDTDPYWKQEFEVAIKDTFEDELADTVIRIMDLCGARGIDLEWHINQKLKYNRTRSRMHGKSY